MGFSIFFVTVSFVCRVHDVFSTEISYSYVHDIICNDILPLTFNAILRPIRMQCELHKNNSTVAFSFYNQITSQADTNSIRTMHVSLYSGVRSRIEENILKEAHAANSYRIKNFQSFSKMNAQWSKQSDNQSSLLIVSFSFNGEHIAFTHIKYLYSLVDLFIITEARTTFSGIQKDHLFIDIFASHLEPFNSKIRYLVIDAFPPMPPEFPYIVDHRYERNISKERDVKENYTGLNGPLYYETWYREEYQRGLAAEYLVAHMPAHTKYLLFVVDADEIVRREVAAELKLYYSKIYEPIYLWMDFYYYSFKWKKNRQEWMQPFVVRDSFITNMTLHTIRTLEFNRTTVSGAGWHCSYCTSVGEIVRKIESFSHIEYNREDLKTREVLLQKLHNGLDLFNRAVEIEGLSRIAEEDLQLLPEELQEFQRWLDSDHQEKCDDQDS